VILFALLNGHLPFDDDNMHILLKKVTKKEERKAICHTLTFWKWDLGEGRQI
jgi:hypothetical protein